MQPEIEPSLGPKNRQRPARTLLWYLLSIAVVYIVLFETVGMKTALQFLGSGKAYNEVLVSLLELHEEKPDQQKRIFFFGDSTVAILDNDVAPPALLQRELERERGPNRVQVIDWAFAQASMFHYYCLASKAHEYSPSLIIFNINYRTYGRHWQEYVRDADGAILHKELVVWAPWRENFSEGVTSPLKLQEISTSNRIKLGLDFWEVYYIRGIKLWLKDSVGRMLPDSMSLEDEWQYANAEWRTRSHQVVRILSELELSAETIRSFYTMNVPRNDPEILALQALTDALKRRGIPFVAYLTPLNIQQFKDYGVYDEEAFRGTVGYIEQIITSEGGFFVDMSNMLESNEFQDRLEHYKPEAARKIVQRLVPIVRETLQRNRRVGGQKVY